jgi:hypothetical protein
MAQQPKACQPTARAPNAQTHGTKADAARRNGKGAEREDSAHGVTTHGDPSGHRFLQSIKPVADADVNERQSEQAGWAAILPGRFRKTTRTLRRQQSEKILAAALVRADGKGASGDEIDGNQPVD